jgi:hypothetical protein
MIRTLIAAIATVPLGCGAAFSQIATGAPVPSPLGITSPLGMAPGSPVPPAGIPMGATELASPGLSPAAAATIGMTGNSTTCSAMGSPSSGISGSSTIYDGGGMGLGTGTSLPGSAQTLGPCGASLSAATPSALPGGIARTGIPLGSVEIGNAGVSPLLVVPAPMPSPSTMGSGMPCSTTGFSPSSSSMSSGC